MVLPLLREPPLQLEQAAAEPSDTTVGVFTPAVTDFGGAWLRHCPLGQFPLGMSFITLTTGFTAGWQSHFGHLHVGHFGQAQSQAGASVGEGFGRFPTIIDV